MGIGFSDFIPGWGVGRRILGIGDDSISGPARAAFPETAAAGDTLVGRVFGLIPSLDDEVTVEVTGQPGITKQQLYFLALATANGMVRRFGDLFDKIVPAYGSLVIEYDAASHWVRCTIMYRWSMAAVIASGPSPVVASSFDRMAVYRGPQCEVNGGDFDFLATGGALPPALPVGIPKSAVSPDAPQLPFQGQPIMTACPTTPTPNPGPITQDPAPSAPLGKPRQPGIQIASPNPKPPGDNRSRGAVIVPSSGLPGSVGGGTPLPGPTAETLNARCCAKLKALIPLVYSALSESATSSGMTYPAPTAGELGG